MSLVHYKFKSVKDFDTYAFEGSGIPVWELKQEIINAKKLAKANDFDLILSNAQTGQEYIDDTTIIPRNSSIIVRRVPTASGRRFVMGLKPTPPLYAPQTSPIKNPSNSFRASNTDEDAKIAAMMSESSSHWNQNAQMPSQAQFSANRRIFRPKGPSLPPPPNYICFRCGQKGHFISHCPTNSDPTFNRPRIRKTTGIPKTFLKPVEMPPLSLISSGLPDSGADLSVPLPSHALLTAEGSLVVAEPNEQIWSKLAGFQKLASLASAQTSFNCPLCGNILANPVYSDCCPSINYCEECLKRALRNDGDFCCKSCQNKVTFDKIHSNDAIAQEILVQFRSDDLDFSTAKKRKLL